jgi:hypothetical protein
LLSKRKRRVHVDEPASIVAQAEELENDEAHHDQG